MVELWVEADASIGILEPLADKWRVHFQSHSGDNSATVFYESAERMRERGKFTHICYVGDFGISGLNMDRVCQRRLEQFDAGKFSFTRVALTWGHVHDYALDSSPFKQGHSEKLRDEYFERWGTDQEWEIDAMDHSDLREIVAAALSKHMGDRSLSYYKRREKKMRDQIRVLGEHI